MKLYYVLIECFTEGVFQSRAPRPFTQQLVQANNKANLKVPRYWPFHRETPVTEGFPSQGPGSCFSKASWRCRNPFSQWQHIFPWKLFSHWLKVLRQHHYSACNTGPRNAENDWWRHHLYSTWLPWGLTRPRPCWRLVTLMQLRIPSARKIRNFHPIPRPEVDGKSANHKPSLLQDTQICKNKRKMFIGACFSSIGHVKQGLGQWKMFYVSH